MYIETTLMSIIRGCTFISFRIVFALWGDEDGITMHPDEAASSGDIETTGPCTAVPASLERWGGRRGSLRANEEAGQV